MIALDTLPALLGGRWLSPGVGTVMGASIDTRTLEPGRAFFALPGTRVDGHDYLPQAAGLGAAVAIVQREVSPPPNLPVLRVEDTKAALWTLAAHHRATLQARVVAVMGSNGKTTTVRVLASVLMQAMPTHASARSFNNALGLPLTILNTPPTARALVCELGEGEPGALRRYVELARPDAAIVTSVGRAHVGELGGMEGVRREFIDALSAMPAHATRFVPDTEEWLLTPCATAFQSANARHENGRVEFELADGTRWRLPVPGLHNASNAAAAIAVARHLGLGEREIARGLEAFEPADMRLSVREVSGAMVLVDCYNANPDSMAAGLRTLADLGRGSTTVAVLGDMLELGPDAPAWHRQIGELARELAAERVFIGPQSRAAHEAGGGVWFASAEEARGRVASLMRPGTVVLLKASRGMALERLLEGLNAPAVA